MRPHERGVGTRAVHAHSLRDVPDAEASEFIACVEHPVRRRDAETLVALMARATQQAPSMWGSSIVATARITTTTKAAAKAMLRPPASRRARPLRRCISQTASAPTALLERLALGRADARTEQRYEFERPYMASSNYSSPPWQGGALMNGFNCWPMLVGHPVCGFVRLRPA